MNKVSNKQYISDVINIEDIDKWNKDEIVFIEAPTGRGKSHFIKNTLAEHNRDKKILLLVSRILIKNQSDKELLRQDIDNVTITTYQNIANKILLRKEIEFTDCDYIICDESHFFCEDSEYIYEGDLVFDWIMSKSSIKIFMTATGHYIKSYLKYELGLKIKLYKIKNTYEFIEKLYFYEDDDVIKKLLLELPPNEKAIYFTSANKAHELSEMLDSCVFYCSKNNSLSRYVDTDSIKYIEENECFQEHVLCTTKAMDCGVNIKDTQVKHIIVDMVDLSTIIQCIGRKRIVEDEKIIVYIKNKKGNSIARRLENLQYKIRYANILKEQGIVKLVEENAHKNTYGNLIYDVINPSTLQIDKKINELMYYTYNENIKLYQSMMKDCENSFKEKLFERMGINMDSNKLEEVVDSYTLKYALDKLVGIKMFKEEQQKFKEFLTKELFNTAKTNHGFIGLKTINGYFEENDIPYFIESKKENSRKDKNYKKNYWIISKRIYEL